eukprot:scaffold499_cov335-Pavlova_lutheri.AAC.11
MVPACCVVKHEDTKQSDTPTGPRWALALILVGLPRIEGSPQIGDSSVRRQGMDLVESRARLSRVTPLPNVPPLEQEWAPEDAPPWYGAWRGAP